MNLACLGFLCVTLPINAFPVDPLLLKRPVPLGKKYFLGSVLVFPWSTEGLELRGCVSGPKR